MEIKAKYEVMLLRQIVSHYDQHNTLGPVQFRSLNYATKRITKRAVKNGASEEDINYRQPRHNRSE